MGLLLGLVVVALGLLSIAAFESWGPFAPGPASTVDASDPTFSEAQAIASGRATSSGAGPWTTWAGVGLVNPKPAELSTGAAGAFAPSLSNVANCTFSPAAGVGASLSIHGFSGPLSSGESPAWLVYLRNASGVGVVIGVLSGGPRLLATLSGAGCPSELIASEGIGGGDVDSSVAVTAALEDGGSTFLSDHPGAGLTLTALAGFDVDGTPGAASWTVELSTCAAGSSSSGSTAFVAVVGMASGRVSAPPSVEPVSCAS